MSNNDIAAPCFFPNGLNDDKETFTACVLGVPRGGTSMVSGILQIMGINMGNEVNADNLEDQDFLAHRGDRAILKDHAHPGRNNFLAGVRASIAEKNAANSIWGWKDPLAIYYLRDISALLRNPLYIWITRDAVAVSEREFLMQKPKSGAVHAFTYINQALSQYQQIGEFLSTQKRPVLLVSYERALRNPAALYSAFAEFIGFEKDPAVLNKVVHYVQPDRLTANLGYTPAASHAKPQSNHEIHQPKMHTFEALRETAEEEEQDVAKLINAAEQDMLSRQYQTCISKLERALLHFENVLPALLHGPQAISASLRYAVGRPNVPAIPDVVVKILYLIGMAQLQLGLPHEAITWFSASFDLAAKKLMYREEPLPESEKYLIWAKFHEAFAAKQLASITLLTETRQELASLKHLPVYLLSDTVRSAYNQAIQRANVEFAV